jgi:hypothetical protein
LFLLATYSSKDAMQAYGRAFVDLMAVFVFSVLIARAIDDRHVGSCRPTRVEEALRCL